MKQTTLAWQNIDGGGGLVAKASDGHDGEYRITCSGHAAFGAEWLDKSGRRKWSTSPVAQSVADAEALAQADHDRRHRVATAVPVPPVVVPPLPEPLGATPARRGPRR